MYTNPYYTDLSEYETKLESTTRSKNSGYVEEPSRPGARFDPPSERRNKAEAEAMVLEMLRKRKEQRELQCRCGSQTERSHILHKRQDTPQGIVARKLQEIENITHDGEYPSQSPHQSTSILSPNNLSIHRDTSKASHSRKNSGQSAQLEQSFHPTLINSAQKSNVFDRLTSDARNKLNESRMGQQSSAKKQRPARAATAAEGVEERLMKYPKERDLRMMQLRTQRQVVEQSQMQSGPLISPASDAIVRSHSGVYGSLVERFEALEAAKQKRQLSKMRERIDAEMLGVTGVPEINSKSKELVRDVRNLLSWELSKRRRQDESQLERKREEQVELIQNSARSYLAGGSSRYLEKSGRSNATEPIEASLIRYGETTRRKREAAAMVDENTYTPNLSPATLLKPSTGKKFQQRTNSMAALPVAQPNGYAEEIPDNILQENVEQPQTINEMKGCRPFYETLYERAKRCGVAKTQANVSPRYDPYGIPQTSRACYQHPSLRSSPYSGHDIQTERSPMEGRAMNAGVVARNNAWMSNRDEKLVRERTEREMDQFVGCTFRPTLVARSTKNSTDSGHYYGETQPYVPFSHSDLKILNNSHSYARINEVRSRSKSKGRKLDNSGSWHDQRAY